jgi:hypothetical protein
MIWVSFFLKIQIEKNCCDWGFLFLTIASHVAKHQKIPIGLISSSDDKEFLKGQLIEYGEHIKADVSGKNGAQTKLKAILKYLPENHALCDMDVLWTKGIPQYNNSLPCALNPEPLLFYKDHRDEDKLIKSCVPNGNITANAGFLYAPQNFFREYAQKALSFSETTDCIGHTYEQMFFVRFFQEKEIPLKFLYNKKIHSHLEIEKCYQESGIRHPFSFKVSLQEVQRFITIGKQFGDYDFIKNLVHKKYPFFRSMVDNEIFKPIEVLV